jgi:hypothetical protein
VLAESGGVEEDLLRAAQEAPQPPERFPGRGDRLLQIAPDRLIGGEHGQFRHQELKAE